MTSTLRAWGAGLWAVGAIIVIALTLTTATIRNDHYKSALLHTVHTDHFWLVVAGQIPSGQATVDNALADDLRVRLGKHGANAPLPVKITSMLGREGSYGGVRDVLGFDPFDSSICDECGPLTTQTLRDLLTVKHGGLPHISIPKKPNNSPLFIFMACWLALGPILGLAEEISKKRKQHREYPDETHLLAQLNEIGHELPPADYARLRGGLVEIMHGNDNVRTKAIVEEVEEQIAARRAAAKELDGS